MTQAHTQKKKMKEKKKTAGDLDARRISNVKLYIRKTAGSEGTREFFFAFATACKKSGF